MPTDAKRLLDRYHKHRIYVRWIQAELPDFAHRILRELSPRHDIHTDVFQHMKMLMVALALENTREARARLATCQQTWQFIKDGHIPASGDWRARFLQPIDGFGTWNPMSLSSMLWKYQSWQQLRIMRRRRTAPLVPAPKPLDRLHLRTERGTLQRASERRVP